ARLPRSVSFMIPNPGMHSERYLSHNLSADIALNRIMKATVIRLAGIARSQANRRRLQDLAFAYTDIAQVPVTALRWDQVVLDRTNNRWADLLKLAKLLLSDQFQTTTSGLGTGYSLLFDMNVLFEEKAYPFESGTTSCGDRWPETA
ncbi:McrC family protein, partial [Roseospira navarrensis]|nr:hypothetical protein [Roseospira navarrensis]